MPVGLLHDVIRSAPIAAVAVSVRTPGLWSFTGVLSLVDRCPKTSVHLFRYSYDLISKRIFRTKAERWDLGPVSGTPRALLSQA